jgi:hypothetical protein
LYRSPGYPSTRTVTHLNTPSAEEEGWASRRGLYSVGPGSPPPTRIFTSSGGITRLRTLSPPPPDEDAAPPRPFSPDRLLPRAESSSTRCPHCTIHAWLPHSPSCPQRPSSK